MSIFPKVIFLSPNYNIPEEVAKNQNDWLGRLRKTLENKDYTYDIETSDRSLCTINIFSTKGLIDTVHLVIDDKDPSKLQLLISGSSDLYKIPGNNDPLKFLLEKLYSILKCHVCIITRDGNDGPNSLDDARSNYLPYSPFSIVCKSVFDFTSLRSAIKTHECRESPDYTVISVTDNPFSLSKYMSTGEDFMTSYTEALRAQ